MKAVVLAGGKGRRLEPYSRVIPKPLMPIGDMPILEVLLRQMKIACIEDVVLTVGHMAELLHLFFQDGKRFGLHITYSYEDTPLGTAGPLAMVEGLDEPFLVTNSDILTTMPICDLLAFHRAQGAIATIAMHKREIQVDLGVIQCGDDNLITGYIEKPALDYLVSMGMYVFDPRVISYIPTGQYLDFPNLVHRLLEAGEKVVGFPFGGYWQDLGRPDDYERASKDFENIRDQFLPEA